MSDAIEDFLAAGSWAVVGASTNREKYGNKVLRCYLQNDKAPLFAVNPRDAEVEGVPAFQSLADLPEIPRAISIITPPSVTDVVVAGALELGVEHFWMQPGAESEEAVGAIEDAGKSVIAGGPCLLVVLGYRE